MDTTIRKICVVTGSRAEYGLLTPTLKAINQHPSLDLQLVVTGSHLSNFHGYTLSEIQADGFTVDAEVEMLLTSDSSSAVAKSTALAVSGFADVFKSLQPSVLLVLGDRYEVFAAAQAAMFARIPIAHVHGGELTEGLIDEAIRHSLTKLSHLHFVASDQYRKRVIQLGENPQYVWNSGATCVERINSLPFKDFHQLTKKYSFDFSHPFFLFTYHPETLSKHINSHSIYELLEILAAFDDFNIVITGTNADVGGVSICSVINEFCGTNCTRIFYRESLGQIDYLSAMRLSKLVIGNSSSGVIEAPILKVPSVNIGIRQQGRIHPLSVINSPFKADSIISSIRVGLSTNFREQIAAMEHPFGNGTTSQTIVDVLATCNLDQLLRKTFYDLP